MAVPRRVSTRIQATSRPAEGDIAWRDRMSERVARSSPRIDPAIERSAACTGAETNLFFPRPNDTAAVEAAKDICRTCSVMRACLMQALRTNDDHAILGATTPDERRLIRRRIAEERRGGRAVAA